MSVIFFFGSVWHQKLGSKITKKMLAALKRLLVRDILRSEEQLERLASVSEGETMEAMGEE